MLPKCKNYNTMLVQEKCVNFQLLSFNKISKHYCLKNTGLSALDLYLILFLIKMIFPS